MDEIFQVSTKQSELGIGQTNFKDYRFEVVDFLPAMYMQQNLLASQKPKKITSYDTIIIPFGKNMWFATFCCIIAQFLLLVVMQNLWSYLSGTGNPEDFIFEGLSQVISMI